MVYRGMMHLVVVYFFIRNTRLDDSLPVKVAGGFGLLILFTTYEVLQALGLDNLYYLGLVLSFESLLLFVYLIFYNKDVFLIQMKWFLPLLGVYLLIMLINMPEMLPLLTLVGLWVTCLNQVRFNRVTGFVLVAFTAASLLMEPKLMVVAMIILFDGYVAYNVSENLKNMDILQGKFLAHQYEEIKNVYLNMRGWRHDYHNHIQAMKAYLAMGTHGDLEVYLNKLECELESVDHRVQTGNIMMDAILNSKVSIMLKHEIKVDCKVVLPDSLMIKDVDLCVMVSNLLDNAIESCLALEKKKRFIRIYAEVFSSQFYLSVQNSAVEDLTFNQKRYISTKRGDHGLGLKRVQFLTHKYGGYLNLQNEPGVFASEISLPL